MKILIFTAIEGRQHITDLFLMGVKRLSLFSGHDISLFCVCSTPEDKAYLKSKEIDYCVYPNKPLSDKLDYGFKQCFDKDFDYILRLGSDDLLDHNIFNQYYDSLMNQNIQFFGLKTIGLINFENLESCIYKYNIHRNDMLLGGGSMIAKQLALNFKDKPLYNKKPANRGMDMASETELRRYAAPVIVKTDKPMLIDVKSDTNIWGYKFTAKNMPKVSYSDLSHFVSIEEDIYMRRNKYRCVAVIPVKGRHPLLKLTITRLIENNCIYKVICVGDEADRAVCESAGAEFVQHENKPLGKKWNAGFLKAKEYNPDCCLFVGSSDWVSDNWLDYTLQYIDKYDMIGKPDFYLLDYGQKLRLCHWKGYRDNRRKDEPIGIGRVLSKRILDKMKWQPMDDKLDSSLDWSMYQKVLLYSGKVKMITSDEIKSLSLSTSAWENKHSFNGHWNNSRGLESERIENHIEFLTENFKQAFIL